MVHSVVGSGGNYNPRLVDTAQPGDLAWFAFDLAETWCYMEKAIVVWLGVP